jgi:histidine kinase-like protein
VAAGPSSGAGAQGGVLAGGGRAAVVSRHPATLKHVAQALAVARLASRQAIGPSFLPRSAPGEFEVVLLDLDIDPSTPSPELCAQVAAACSGTPIVVLAGVNARHRLVQALGHGDVVGLVPKIGAWAESSASSDAKVEGPDEQLLGVALRRRVARETQPVGPSPYLLGGTTLEERVVGGTLDKETALTDLLADAARYGLSDEKVRRVETAADELMLNGIYDAPRDESGKPLHADLDRRTPVKLAAQSQVRVRWGCDGRSFVVSVTDRFGALARATVATHVQKLLDARSPRLGRGAPGDGGGAGLGLVLAFSAANDLVVQVAPGRFTEVTAALHIAGSNRAAVARGSSLHIYD